MIGGSTASGVVMSGRPQPQEVVAILVALRAAAVPPAPPPRARRRPPILLPLAIEHGSRAWRLAPAGVV